MTREPELTPRLLAADALPEDRELARRRTTASTWAGRAV